MTAKGRVKIPYCTRCGSETLYKDAYCRRCGHPKGRVGKAERPAITEGKTGDVTLTKLFRVFLVVLFVSLAVALLIGGLISELPPGSSVTLQPVKGPKEIKIYIDPPPQGTSDDVVRAAMGFWEKRGQVVFVESGQKNADVYVSWVKEFGTAKLGHTVLDRVVEIGLGDSNCMEKWYPYSRDTILKIAEHELGHALGYGHSNDPNDIMFATMSIKYDTTSLEQTIKDGGVAFIPVCSFSNPISIHITVRSTNNVPVEVYLVPSMGDYSSYIAGQAFHRYPECSTSTETTSYDRTCVVSLGSGLILRNPTFLGLGAASNVEITMTER